MQIAELDLIVNLTELKWDQRIGPRQDTHPGKENHHWETLGWVGKSSIPYMDSGITWPGIAQCTHWGPVQCLKGQLHPSPKELAVWLKLRWEEVTQPVCQWHIVFMLRHSHFKSLPTSCYTLPGTDPSVRQWERKVVVNGETFIGWKDTGAAKTIVKPQLIKPYQMLPGCEIWCKVSGVKAFTQPTAQMSIQT